MEAPQNAPDGAEKPAAGGKMSEIIESIKQSANQVLSELDQKGQIKSTLVGIRHQWSEVERRRNISSLGGEVKKLQAETKQLTEALGLQALALFDVGKIAHPELSRLCERINEIRVEKDQKKAELLELKAQTKPKTVACPQCQTQVQSDAEFCPKCGGKIEPPARPEAPAVPPQRKVVRERCPKCKTILPPQSGFCPSCGVKLKRPQDSVKHFCPSCGAEMSAQAKFCPICGQTAS